MKISEFKPVIPNEKHFCRRHITSAVMRLGYTKNKKAAELMAKNLINRGIVAGEIMHLSFTQGRSHAYAFA